MCFGTCVGYEIQKKLGICDKWARSKFRSIVRPSNFSSFCVVLFPEPLKICFKKGKSVDTVDYLSNRFDWNEWHIWNVHNDRKKKDSCEWRVIFEFWASLICQAEKSQSLLRAFDITQRPKQFLVNVFFLVRIGKYGKRQKSKKKQQHVFCEIL